MAQAFDVCRLVSQELSPEYVVDFLAFHPVRSFGFDVHAADPGEALPEVMLGEAPVEKATAFIGVELPVRQQWQAREIVLNDLVGTIGLAPGEKASFRVRRSQRTRLDRKTMEEKTQLLTAESSMVDKDVLSATRNTVLSMKWNTTSKGEVSLYGMVDLGGGTDFGMSAQETVSRTSEQVREATRSSTEKLGLTQRVEIVESRESLIEEEEQRVVENPYRDRAMQIHFFDLRKNYEISHRFGGRTTRAQIVLVLDFQKLLFDVLFVRRNIAFMDEHLLERHLLGEYLQLIRDPDVSFEQEHSSSVERMARIALEYLFRHDDIFGFHEDHPGRDVSLSFQTQGPDLNAPPQDAFTGASAFANALQGEVMKASLYGGLAFFYRIYTDLVRNEGNNRIAFNVRNPGGEFSQAFVQFEAAREIRAFKVELAVALADFIAGHLSAEAEEQLNHLYHFSWGGNDFTNRTEVFRRLSGYVAMVHGMIAPRRGEDEPRRRRNERLAAIEARLAEHLGSYNGFYRRRYVEFIAERMHSIEFVETFRDLHPHFAADGLVGIDSLSSFFAFELGYAEGSRYIVPSRFIGDLAQAGDALEEFLGEPPGTFEFPEFIHELTQRVSLPVDGVHVEAVPGFCTLPDVPAACEKEVDLDVDLRVRQSGGPCGQDGAGRDHGK